MPFETETEVLFSPTLLIELINDTTYETEAGSSLTGLFRSVDTIFLFPVVENDLATV